MTSYSTTPNSTITSSLAPGPTVNSVLPHKALRSLARHTIKSAAFYQNKNHGRKSNQRSSYEEISGVCKIVTKASWDKSANCDSSPPQSITQARAVRLFKW